MATIHFTLQGKGGVGKSVISAWLTQFLLEQGLDVSCMDTDPSNATFAGYKEFNVQIVDIMTGNKVDERKFDALMELIFSAPEDMHIVIDNGASSFIPLMAYLKENDAISVIQAEGHKVFLHTIVTGGQSMKDTLQGLHSLCRNFAGIPIVIWLNLFFGEIRDEEKNTIFEEFPVYRDNIANFHGIISIPMKNKDTFGKDVEGLLTRKESFAKSISSTLPTMERQRLKIFKGELFREIAQANLC